MCLRSRVPRLSLPGHVVDLSGQDSQVFGQVLAQPGQTQTHNNATSMAVAPSRVESMDPNNNPEDYRDQHSLWRSHGQTQTAMAMSSDFCEVTSRAAPHEQMEAHGTTLNQSEAVIALTWVCCCSCALVLVFDNHGTFSTICLQPARNRASWKCRAIGECMVKVSICFNRSFLPFWI